MTTARKRALHGGGEGNAIENPNIRLNRLLICNSNH